MNASSVSDGAPEGVSMLRDLKPTQAQIDSACMSYRHDFGLLTGAERERVQAAARHWLEAWQKEIGLPRVPAQPVERGWMPKVKALEWEQSTFYDTYCLKAPSVAGDYWLITDRGRFSLVGPDGPIGHSREFSRPADGMPVAQADFERRILSALDLLPSVEDGDGGRGKEDGLPLRAAQGAASDLLGTLDAVARGQMPEELRQKLGRAVASLIYETGWDRLSEDDQGDAMRAAEAALLTLYADLEGKANG